MPSNVFQTLADAAEASPDRVAVRMGDQTVTYADLLSRVDAAACALQEAGVTAGDRVALMMGNRVSFVVGLYAAWRTGAVVVPVNPSLTAPEVAHELSDSRARVIVIGRAYVDVIAALRGTQPDLEHVFVADSTQAVDPDSGTQSWHGTLEAHGGRRPEAVGVGEETLALLAYTSGTTGVPKGAMLTHGQLLANHHQLAASSMGVQPDDIVFNALPLYHIYALNVALALTLAAGATLELVERFDPSGNLDLIVQRRATVIVGAPPMYVAWLNTPGADQADLSHVRLATSGAAGLPAKILLRCADELGLDVREGYGLTEAAPVVASTAALPQTVPGCVGQPLQGIELRVIDDGDLAHEGDPGVIHIRGANVFSGYWEQPDATAEVLSDDGWLDTGDIGYVADGLLYLVDRAKDIIIVSGFNVYPVEVEAALVAHPAVMQAAVVGVLHPYTGEAVKAFVVLDPDSDLTADELINHSATMLARFKQPAAVEFVSDLPMLPTGKLKRRELRT
ncbi:long-chain fatty acid--CoA ligase [soil metagenome]